MAWMCARDAFRVLVATSLVVMLSAWPLAAQEADGEASSEEPRFDVFWGGGVSFAEDLGIPFTLDAGVTAWLWDWWGGTWGGGAWFTGMPAVNQGSVTLALRRGYSVGSRGHFQLGAALLRRRLFRLFIGVFARRRSLSVHFARGQRPGQRPPASFGRPARPESRCPDASVVPFAPLDIRAAFWYDALGREMPLRWP